MSKQQAQLGSNTTTDSLGLPDLASNPVIRQADAQRASLSRDKLYHPDTTDLVQGRGINQDKSELDKLPNGPNLSGSDTDIEHQLGDSQSWTSQGVRGLLRGVSGIPIQFVGQLNNMASGIDYLLGDKDAFKEGKPLSDYLDGITENIRQALPIHASTRSDSDDLSKKVFSSQFWTGDVMAEGAPFVIALALGSKGLGAALAPAGDALGALSKSASLAEMYSAVPATQKIATAIANKFTTSTIGFLGAAAMAGMQAKGTGNQIEQRMRQDLSSKVDPETGSIYTQDAIDKHVAKNKSLIDDKVHNTFWATMATELLPSIYASKLFLGAGKAEMGQLNSKIMKAVNSGEMSLEDIKAAVGKDAAGELNWGTGAGVEALAKTGGKSALAGAGHAAGVGAIAMNLQMSIQKYDINQALAGNDKGIVASSLGYARQFLDNLTDSEEMKGIVMGSILGGITGAISGAKGATEENSAMLAHLNSMKASEALFGEVPKMKWKTDPADQTGTKLILDKNGDPIEDPDKIARLTWQALYNKNNWDNATVAVVTANSDMATMHDHTVMASMIAKELQSGRYGSSDEAREYFKWFHKTRITEQSLQAAKEGRDTEVEQTAPQQAPTPEQGAAASVQTQSAMKTGSAAGDATLSKYANENSQLIDKMFNHWDVTGRQAGKLTRFGESSDKTTFNENIQHALYYESIKRESYAQMVKDKEAEMKEIGADKEGLNEQTEVLGRLMQDSMDRSKDMLSKPEDLFEAWSKERKLRGSLGSDMVTAAEKFEQSKAPADGRAADTAAYKWQEHAAKEGINPSTGSADTDKFLTNQPMQDRAATPVGLRNDLQFKAGSDYMKLGRLNDIIDKVRSGEASLTDATNYAADNITNLDEVTKQKLRDLIAEQKTNLSADEQKLANTQDFDEETMQVNPDYQELEQSIDQRKKAIEDASSTLDNKGKTTELNMLNRQPEKVEETLNKQFAEKQFDKANNVIANAIDDNQQIKDSYTDTRSVTQAIDQVIKMRNAIEDRMKSGDLKGQDQYQYLIDKADQVLEVLTDIRNATVDNQLKRDGKQQYIGRQQAGSNSIGLGFNLDTNSVSYQPIFNAADQILGGKLQDMLTQLKSLPSGNYYEGTMAILHALKTAGSAEDLKTMFSLMDEQIDNLLATMPDPSLSQNRHYKTDLVDSPELYFSTLLPSLKQEGYEAMSLEKGSPLATFKATNNIDEFEQNIANLPADTKELGAPKQAILDAIKAYRDIVGIDRVKNLLNSRLDLSKTVGDEITAAKDSNGIVPTTQQEISIRDGLAWLSSNKEVGKEKFDGWGFLRGIAGTGKTSVAVKWLLDLCDLKSTEVLASAGTDKAASVLGVATGTEATHIDELMEKGIPTGKKLIVVDEYARIPTDRLEKFEQKVREHNKELSPADRVRVLILGDPTQITPLTFANQDITSPVSNKAAKSIRVINPLTVVYRSDVSAVNEASDIFQANSKPVESINVRADRAMNEPLAVGVHTSKTAQDIQDIVKYNIAEEQRLGIAPRTRAVITSTPGKYTDLGIPVMTVYDSQSETFQEVYVDMSANEFHDPEKFNTAMYTALSRAKEYTYVRHDNGTNTTDPGLSREKENNDQIGREAKELYTKNRIEEQTMMAAAVAGKSIAVTKPEMAVKIAEQESPLEKATEPATPEDEEIVTDIPSAPIDQVLPPAEPSGHLDPETETEVPPTTPIQLESLGDNEHLLPNIEKGTFEALGGRRNEQVIGNGSKVTYMYTRESNGENAITAFAHDPDGNWIPVSKIFKEEIDKFPQYAAYKAKVATMQPMFTSDPQQLNGGGGRAAYTVDSMAPHKVDEATVTQHQKLTYVFGNEPVQTGIAAHIKAIFKSKFFSPKTSEQDKADKLLFRIFRNNELASHKFGGFTPEAGIPYAVVGAEPGTRDWSKSQFVRLTANRLSNQSEHYQALKAYRDSAKEIEDKTGVSPGTADYNLTVRALRDSLKIEHEPTPTGTEPRVRIKDTYTRKDFNESLKRVTPRGNKFKDPLEHLSDAQFEQILPKMQALASMLYGIHETKAELTPSELEAAHGTDYEHLPLKTGEVRTKTNEDGTTTEEPVGRARLKGTGPGTGRKDVYIPDWELNTKKGIAQQALNQLAKANEYVGDTRIRTDEYKTDSKKVARSTTSTGKSLITEKGGDAAIYSSRKALAKILGESQVQEGKLDEADLEKKEVRTQLENEIRRLAGEHDMDAKTLGAKLLSESGLSEDRKDQLTNELNAAVNKKETPPVTMRTLDLLVGDHNYDASGQHLTEDSYNVTNPKSGITKNAQTYLRTPLDIDQFNELGKSPEANSEELSKFVGTKFQDILPTQIAVSRSGEPVLKVEPGETAPKVPTIAPGSERAAQDKIDELQTQLATLKPGREKMAITRELRKLIDERDNTSRLFDKHTRAADKGQKITAEQATAEIKRMLPSIQPHELAFLNKSLIIELQRPGESLLGLFHNGKISLLDDNGVYGNVVRHEVFHKVFNDYLTARERQAVSNEFDPQGKMNPVDLEEALADKFMTYQKAPETFSGKVKRLFNKIASWFGLAQSTSSITEKLFNDIQDGKFQSQDGETSNSRMAFSDIRKWGTVQDYKDASRYLQKQIYRFFIDDNIENQPLTQGELFDSVKQHLQEAFKDRDELANSYVEAQDVLANEYNAADSDEERKALQEEIDVYNNEAVQTNLELKMLHTFTTDPKVLRDLWSDIYPNFSFKKSGIVSTIEDNPEKDDPESLERTEDEEAKSEHSLRSDFILNSDEKNQETKISQNVKNFLSFIYRPATTGRNAKDESRVNPRGVYLLSLRNLANMRTGEADFIQQLQKRAKDNGINLNSNTDASLVINKLLTLYHNASGDAYVFNKGRDSKGNALPHRVELPLHNRFLDENTFVTDLSGKDISGITAPSEGHLVINRNGRSTADFLKELMSSNITAEQAKGYFKQFQAQETLREIMSNFTSQREATPMIAEEVNDFGRIQLRYFRAQAYGIERVQTTDLENSFKENWHKAVKNTWDKFDKVVPQDQNRAVADLLKHLGVDGEHIRSSDSSLVSAVYGDIQAFKKVVESTIDGIASSVSENASDSDESIAAPDPVAIALENNSGMLDRLTRLLTRNSADERASAYTDVKGQKRYLYHNGSQAHDTIESLKPIDAVGNLPKHLTNDPVLSKNIFASGLNKIYEMLDHDGIRQEGREEFASDYSNENNKQWLERNFSYGFLSFLKTNARDNADALTYAQPFYTISNRPRMNMGRVEVLSEPKVREALIKGIEQHLEQPDHSEAKNYDRFKAVNFDEMHRALEKIHGVDMVKDPKSKEGRAKLTELYGKIALSDTLKSELADHMVGQLKEQAEQAMQRMKKENVRLSSDSHEAIKLLKDKRRQILPDEAETPQTSLDGWPEDDQMRPAVESYYMNNYVNSYFMNQAVAGNMNYFKSALDMVKRMSGIFAPGTKGIVGDRFFMQQRFNAAIADDPKMKAEYLSPIFKDTKLMEAVGKKSFDLADAQGFMTPERAANIVQGFGQNYNAGAVFKPAHYEVAPRTLEDGTVTHVPVMLKYSSVVLSDDLVSRFPKLAALREEMRAKDVHEFIFDSGTKVGAPEVQTRLPEAIDYNNNKITIDPKSVLSLSNENYRLQLNPSAEAYDKVSNPTQLGYFLNVMHKITSGGARNLTNAEAVYSAIGEKISRGIAKLSETALDTAGKIKTSIIKNSLTGPGNERLQEMLGAGLSYNMPNISDKALIQLASAIDKATVKIKFPGGKMILQSSYGMDIPNGNGGQRRLEYQQDDKGRWHAEVLLPKIYQDKANPGDFLLPDAMGFRIPSTELHSSVPLKVAGFYDDKGSNVIVAPAELVAQHGSDFDVDSLSVITREKAASDIETPNYQFKKGEPVGYYPVGDKLQFNPVRYRNELQEAKLEAAGDKKVLGQLEKLHDQFLTNQITESFLDTISHPDNKDRMLTPISTDVIQQSLDELGVKEDKAVNLSRMLDNLKMYNSNFQGAALVGTFANGMKSLSYISRAGTDGNYPELHKDLAIDWNGHTYDKFSELDHTGGNLWEQLDALVNTSVDNVKEQKLFQMNATDKTGNAYIAAKAIGMPLEETMRMMLQPVIKQFSKTDGGRKTAIDNLKKAIVEHAKSLEIISGELGYSELRALVKEQTPELTKENLDKRIGSNSLGDTPEELGHQIAVLDRFEKINKIGNDLSTFSSAIGILQNMPVFYEDVSKKVDQWAELGQITDGQLRTSSDFAFNLDNLMAAQPNIAEAYKAFQFMKATADKSLIKHFPEVTALANEMAGAMKIKLLYDENANREKLKNEITSYLLSSYYSDELKEQQPVTVDRRKGGQTILTGKQAWSQDFAAKMKDAIKEDKTNAFMKRLSVKEDNYGIKSLQFSNSSNPDTEEALEMQEGFQAIKDQSIKDGLVKYGVLNFGLNFGARNYSMFIPSELLKPVSDYITKDVKSMIERTTLDKDGALLAGPLKNIRDNLAIKLAINNPDKLPYISARKIAPVQTLDEAGKPKTVEINGQLIPVLSGYDGTYYWHRSYNNPVKDSGGLTYGAKDFPEFIKQRDGNGRDVVYRRLNNPETDEKVYYQRAGYKNYSGGYDASHEVIRDGYNPDDYFAKGTIPVSVADLRAGEYDTSNEHIKEGSSVVVYPYSNATREQGISGIVDKIIPSIDKASTKIRFTLRREGAPDRPLEQQRIMDIAHNVAQRFGLDVGTSTELPKGVKGMIDPATGTILMNPELMTRDTVFHEVSHPLIAAIQKQNPAWYQNLRTELNESSDGRSILRKVEAKYPELSKEGQETEALVTAIGQEAAKRLPESNFRSLVRRLMRSIGNTVRSVINEIRTKGGLSLESLAAEDMAKLTIGDIADILAAQDIKLKLDLSKVEDTPQFSKDLGDEEPQKGSPMEAILARAGEITDPTRNEFGQEGDTYEVDGSQVTRISRVMDDFTFREKKENTGPDGKPIPSEDAIAKRDADRMYKTIAPGGKLIIDGIEQTREEYEANRKKILVQGIAKGNIIHAKIQRFFAVLQGDTAKVSELDSKIEELSSMADKLPSAYDWVTRKGVFNKLMTNAGVNIDSKLPKEQQDKIYSEVKIASSILGTAGKVDMMVERPDGRLKIVDWKTGSKLKEKYSSTILKYGVQESRITDNPLDRAKLQLMLYAITIKAEHPTVKFDGLTVMHLPNEHEATLGRNALTVEVPDYLRMLKQYYEHEKPDAYRQILQQSPNIFDPREYNAPKHADFSQDVLNSNGSSEGEVQAKYRLQLQQLEFAINERAKNSDTNRGPTDDQIALRRDLVHKIQQGSNYHGADLSGALDSKYEISIMKRWLGTMNDTHNPYIQVLTNHLKVNEDRAFKEVEDNHKQFNALLRPVLKEKGLERNWAQKALTSVNYKELWSKFYTETRTTDEGSGVDYVRRGATTEKDPNWKTMTPAEQKLSAFMRKNMKDIYHEVMVDGNQAIVGKKLNGEPRTKQDLYNSSHKGANFKYEDNFMPRKAITKEEVSSRILSELGKRNVGAVKDYIQDRFLRYATDFFDNNAEGYNQSDYGLPVRMLGNSNTYASPDSYSMNIEDGYKSFMEQMIRKKHLDGTYMLAQATKGILESANDSNGHPAFKMASGLVDTMMKQVLLGDSLSKVQGKITRHGFAISRQQGREYSLSFLKIYRTAKTGIAAGTLWLQPGRSLINAGQLGYMQGKEATINSLLRPGGFIDRTWGGLKPGEQDLSISKSSYAEAWTGQIAAASGKGSSSFVHNLAKELRLYGSLDVASHKDSEYLTKGSQLMDMSNFGFMYKIPEEVANVQHGLNYLKNLKIQSGNYAGKTMYDIYKESFNPATSKFELPEDFKRGIIQRQDGSFEELKGIHALEINKLHAQIGKLIGNYRQDEKSAIQGTILGDAFMMFKRWIPGMAINQYQSKFLDPTVGQFELNHGAKLEQKNGEDVYQWRARVVEGRMKVLYNIVMHAFNQNKYAGYAWSDLSGEQRKAVVNSATAIASWMGMLAFTSYAYSGAKDDDTAKRLANSMMERVQEEIWLPTMVSAAEQPPAVVKKSNDIIGALGSVLGAGYYAATDGDQKQIRTERGDIRGMNALMKNMPLLGGYYETSKNIENWGKNGATDTTSPF